VGLGDKFLEIFEETGGLLAETAIAIAIGEVDVGVHVFFEGCTYLALY